MPTMPHSITYIPRNLVVSSPPGARGGCPFGPLPLAFFLRCIVANLEDARAALMFDWMRHDACPHCGTSIQGLHLTRHILALSEQEVQELSIPLYLTGTAGGHVASAHWELSRILEPYCFRDLVPVDGEAGP